MLIIGCDFHPGFQQVAILDKQTGEVQEKRLRHRDEAEQFYGSLGAPVRVGMEACGHELWLGDAPEWCASRKPTGATQILRLLIEDRFPKIWTPSLAERDAGQLLVQPSQAGSAADAGEKPIAGDGARSRGAEEMEAVDGGRTRAAGANRTAALRCRATPASAANPRSAASGDRRLEPASESRSPATAASGEADDASRSRSGYSAGTGADAGTGRTLPFAQASGQLLRADSQRALQRRAPAAGAHYQAGQFVFALPAGGGGPVGGTVRF